MTQDGTTCDLASKTCVPCHGGVPAIKGDDLKPLISQLSEWNIIEEHHLRKEMTFPDFASALAFVNRLGELAESQGHHPNIHLTWGKVDIDIWTHKVDGLTESDFILAAKIDELEK